MCRVALQASTNGTEADKKQNEKESNKICTLRCLPLQINISLH